MVAQPVVPLPDKPNSDNMQKPANPFGAASTTSKTLPLAKPRPKPTKPASKPQEPAQPTNGAFIPHPDMEEIEAKRKAYEDSVKREADKKASELNKTFGDKPATQKPVEANDWTHTQTKLNKFYGNLDATFKQYQVPNDQRSKCIHNALEVNSIHETKLSALDAEVKVKAYIEREYMATKKLTPEDWTAWLKAKEWKSTDVLAVLSATNEERGLGKVEGLGQWPSLETAEKIMLDHLAATNGSNGNHEETTEAPAQTKSAASAPASRAGTSANPFRPAVFTDSKLRMALVGPSGSGKTWTALTIATFMIPNGKVAVIDTERGSARKYAKYFKFDVTELRDFHPNTYVKAINDAVAYGYDVLVIDSLSHSWNGENGILSIVNNKGGGFDKWKDVNPILWNMLNTILDAPVHVIATMRVKTDYVMEQYVDGNGKTKTSPRKVGLAPRMKEDMEYEFDVYAQLDEENTMTIDKTRYPELPVATYPKVGKEVAEALNKALTA